ncbi:MAG: hypothetical protein GEV28_12035 [Actinophytocola sp.]|uniref:hypothetical protein n=1 Tax=Actinophytocola sp. TaxID=1872138 RepID=UPI001323BD71|nr:hypothetical protein [Actinophytocola sp.]MPZ81071.1 hypothetical protein [Actinophytocola sp.]
MPRCAAALGPPPAGRVEWNGPRRCAIEQDQPGRPDAESIPSVLDVLAPALERSSVLADELARLLLPARLFS